MNWQICLSLEVLSSLYFIERQPFRTTTTKTQKMYPGNKIFDKLLSSVSYYLPIGKTSMSGTQGMFFVFLQDKTNCLITQPFKLKPNRTFKGPICNIFTILTHKMRMACYQRLRTHALWSTDFSQYNNTASMSTTEISIQMFVFI